MIGICVNSEVDDPTTASSYTWSRFAGVDGTDGVQGPAGADGISTYVHFAYAISSAGEEGFSTTPFEGAKYLGVLTDNVEADSEDPSKYKWSLMRGADGIDGTDGVDGTSVSVEAIQYQQGDSATTPPADESGWSAQPVAVEQGYYLWTRTKFSDGSYAYCVSRQAQDGDHGVSVVNQTMEYYLSMETGELLPAPESETLQEIRSRCILMPFPSYRLPPQSAVTTQALRTRAVPVWLFSSQRLVLQSVG